MSNHEAITTWVHANLISSAVEERFDNVADVYWFVEQLVEAMAQHKPLIEALEFLVNGDKT